MFNIITTEASGDKAIFKAKQSEITMLTKNSGLFPRLFTLSTVFSVYPMNTTDYLPMFI